MVGQVVHCTRGSGRETGSPSQSTLGGNHPSVGRGTPSKHTQGCHLPAKSQMLGSCTGPRGALVSSAPHGLVVCRLGPYAVPSLWQGSITEFLPLLTECRGPLQLHTQAHSQGNSNSWSLTAPGSGVGGAGAYTRSGSATHTHTHTHTHTAPVSAGGQSLPPLCPTSCPAAPIPADTGPDARIQKTSLPRPHRTLHRCTTELVCVATRNTGHPRGGPDTAHKDTQDRPGSTPKPPPNTRAVQLPVDTQPCVSGHSRPQHPTVRHNLRHHDTLGPHTAPERGQRPAPASCTWTRCPPPVDCGCLYPSQTGSLMGTHTSANPAGRSVWKQAYDPPSDMPRQHPLPDTHTRRKARSSSPKPSSPSPPWAQPAAQGQNPGS